MFDQLSAFLAYAAPLAAIALKVGLIIGLLGSAIELVGMFAQRFTNPRAQSFGAACIRVGKTLEAVGADAPKFISNALGWVAKVSQLFGASK
jgi:hypothetical protein